MRREKDLVDDVSDVHTHAIDARRRLNGNPKPLQVALDKPQVSWRQRYFKWENLTVAGREVKGFVVSPTIAAVLLASFIGAVGWAYKSNTADQRETLISITRIETMLDERTKNFDKEQAKLESKIETEHNVAELQREQARKEMMEVKLALQQRGIKLQ